MRSSIGSRSHRSTHRSSLGTSHRSKFSKHRSSLSSMHHSSLSKKRSSGIMKSHRSAFSHHGISDAHAFAVGKATGININSSAMGAHGAALHHSRLMRNSGHRKSKFHSTQSTNFKRKIKFSSTNNSKYKSKKFVLDPLKNDFVEQFINHSRYFFWIPFLIFIICTIIMVTMVWIMMSRMRLFGF